MSEIRRNNRLKQAAADSDLSSVEKGALSLYADSSKKDMYVSIAAAVGGVAALVGYMFHVGLISAASYEQGVEEEEEEEVPDFGNFSAGEFLGL